MRLAIYCLLLAAGAGATEPGSTLVTMRRVFIDRFSGGETAAQLRDMVISSIGGSHLLQITEKEESADVVLRGSGEDLVFTDQHQTSDHLSISTRAGVSDRTGTVSSGSSNGITAGESETSHIMERKHEAAASVRLVNRDGDVIWSVTKESLGGKFRGASADVADKIMKQLVQDIERARASSSTQAGKPSR